MVKVNFFYDTKYGNTNLAAEKIAEGLREIEGIDVDISIVKKVDMGKIGDYDAIVSGRHGKTFSNYESLPQCSLRSI